MNNQWNNTNVQNWTEEDEHFYYQMDIHVGPVLNDFMDYMNRITEYGKVQLTMADVAREFEEGGDVMNLLHKLYRVVGLVDVIRTNTGIVSEADNINVNLRGEYRYYEYNAFYQELLELIGNLGYYYETGMGDSDIVASMNALYGAIQVSKDINSISNNSETIVNNNSNTNTVISTNQNGAGRRRSSTARRSTSRRSTSRRSTARRSTARRSTARRSTSRRSTSRRSTSRRSTARKTRRRS